MAVSPPETEWNSAAPTLAVILVESKHVNKAQALQPSLAVLLTQGSDPDKAT